MSKSMLAGAAAFVLGSLLALVGVLVLPTVSDEAADQVAALVDHRGAVVAGLAIQLVALGLLTAGTVWLAVAAASRAPGLAVAGGVLAVFGYFVVAFESGVTLAAAGIVTVLDSAQATRALDAVGSSAGVSAVEPLTVLGVVGYALLAVGLRRAGVPVWAGALLVVGSAIETAGFATATRPLIVVGFAILAVAGAAIARVIAGHAAIAPATRLGRVAGPAAQ